MARCIIVGAIVTYLLALLQATLGGRLAIAGVPPDLALVWVITVGLLDGPIAGAGVGFAVGLLQGALQQSWIGPFGISKMVSGWGSGLVAAKMFRENWLVPMICGILVTLLNEALFLLLSRAGSWSQAGRVIGVRVVYHALLCPIALLLAMRGRRALMGRRREAV